ncbi:MAG: hypothetical protein VYD18_06725 [Candidatus Latescibacterota bacterium]|nr:hypothetical protein [Candidatus Latescibacterota bacterium]
MSGSDVEARGIYIDIKGVRDRPPVVIGISVDDVFEQVVTDFAFGDAALAKDLRVNRFEDEVRALLARCARESRLIFAFSPHALDVVGRYTPSGGALTDLYEDAQQLALLWHDKSERGGASDWSLADFLADMGQPQPRHLGTRHTTSRLRYVERQLNRHGAYDAISAGAKAKWTKVLQQNESDTRGIRKLVLRSAGVGLGPQRRH